MKMSSSVFYGIAVFDKLLVNAGGIMFIYLNEFLLLTFLGDKSKKKIK